MENHNNDLLNVFQIACHLQVPASTVYYWVGRRQIPFVKMGKHLRFDPMQVRAHFAEQTRMAAPVPISQLIRERMTLLKGKRD